MTTRREVSRMLSLHPLAESIQADRERAIRDKAPVPANRPAALIHPVGPVHAPAELPIPRRQVAPATRS